MPRGFVCKRGHGPKYPKDVPGTLKKLGVSFTVAGKGSELRLDCPDRDCPNPKKHLYMNKHTGLYICHRCGLTGNLLTFIKILKGTTTRIARLILFTEQEESWAPTLGELRTRLKEQPELENEIEEAYGLKSIIKPPPGTIKVSKKKYPVFLANRGIPFGLIKDFNVRMCNSGRYANRIIFPFKCNGNESFVAYRTKDFMKPKTLNAVGSENENLLYPYEWIQANTGGQKILIVVEGIFDMLRLLLYNYRSVALLKSFLSVEQAILLNQCNYEKIIFILDGDVAPERYERNARNVSLITDKPTYFSPIYDAEKDPDKLSRKEVERLIADAKPADAQFRLRARLKKMGMALGQN